MGLWAEIHIAGKENFAALGNTEGGGKPGCVAPASASPSGFAFVRRIYESKAVCEAPHITVTTLNLTPSYVHERISVSVWMLDSSPLAA
jgi:hypothetical protein